MKPNDVVKMSLLPARASCSIARSASGPSLDILEIGGLDLVAERLLQVLTADLVLIGAAEIADRTEIDEPDFQLLGGVAN